MPELVLRLHGSRIGVVEPGARDRTRVQFTIDRDHRQDVVLSEAFAALPGKPPSDAVSNFLGGYVPEGSHRERMAAKRRIDKDDLFALLREFGGSIAGAVTLEDPARSPRGGADYEPLREAELAQRLRQALTDSDQGIPTDSRSTLPGYQPKVLAARMGEGWTSPVGRGHSTHILKPQVPARPHRLYDEHYSHLLASAVGLSRYRSRIARAEDVTYLEIERFDREIDGDEVRLIHQEDLAQALGLDWRDTDVKFQEPFWPDDPKRATVRRIARALAAIPEAADVLDAWVRQLVFHLVIGNNDAHAKNVALMHFPGRTELAQVYDAVPNLFQDGRVSWNLALAVDGEFDHRRLSVDALLREVTSWRVMADARAGRVVASTLAGLAHAVATVVAPEQVSPGMVEQVEWNCARLLGGTEIGERPR